MLSRTYGGRRLWQGLLSVGLLSSLISAAAAEVDRRPPAAPAPPAGIEAEVTDGRLTLRADGAPLADVLRAIGAVGDLKVVLRGGFRAPVRESFADRLLEDALRELLAGHSVVLRHDHPAPAVGAAALAEIRVIENPALAASEAAAADEPASKAADAAADDAGEEPVDREAFRLANLGVAPPTREGILFELEDPDQAARVAAVPKIGSLRPRAALDILAGVFAEEDDPLVRSRAVAALTRLGGPGARGLLRARALADADAELRMQALNALATSSGERSINVLAQALRDDPEPQVREAAVSALGRVGGDWARRYLERAARDPDPAISRTAEQALAASAEDRD
jgi:hypothetical protein